LTKLHADVERQQRREQVRPANWSVCFSANENPNPCTRPKPNVISHRRLSWGETMFSSAMYTIDVAISVSMSGGNHKASGATSYADATSVIE
jgi:hypothetical protein